jgi:predicted transcriptional regulator
MTVVAFELEDKLVMDLKQMASVLKTNEANVVQNAVTNYLRSLRMDKIRAEAQPLMESAGFFSEEDIYKSDL